MVIIFAKIVKQYKILFYKITHKILYCLTNLRVLLTFGKFLKFPERVCNLWLKPKK